MTMHRYLCVLVAMSLSGCIAVGPSYDAPQFTPLQPGFIYGDRPVFMDGEDGEAEGRAGLWFEAFSDPRIAEAVALARTNNRDLQEAFFRLEGAEARASAARRGLLPQGGTGFSVQRQQVAQAAFAGFGGGGAQGGNAAQPQGGNPEFTLYQAQTQLSWEADLFGRLRRQVQGASARAEAQELLLLDTQRLVTARTVDGFILLVEALSRRRVALDNLALQERSMALVEDLYALGEVPKLDRLQQRTQLKVTAAQVKQVEAAVADAAAALALLCGLTVPELILAFPNLLDEEARPVMPSAKAVVALAAPAEVLRRRPDVMAAERNLAAETYDIGVATAGLFPSVSLDGTASLIALDFEGLSDSNAFGYNVGPTINWQILSYPRLLRERAAAKAEAGAALAAYERAVLAALTETDQALALYAGAVEQAALLTEAKTSAADALMLAEARYREGADSLLQFLDAQRTALQTEDQAVQAQALALRTRTAVHRALAD